MPFSPESQAQTGLKSGSGWRVGYRPSGSFVALVGADIWGIELTASEWQAFRKGILTVAAEMAAAAEHLMAEESITLEHCTAELTLTATGDPSCYSLFLRLHSGRRAEGRWDPAAVTALVETLKGLEWGTMQPKNQPEPQQDQKD